MDLIKSLLVLWVLIGTNPPATTTQIQAKPYDTLDLWISKLAYCESRLTPDKINPHDGGSPSYGYLQFKMSTFKYYSRKLGLFKDAEDKELENIIMDPVAQQQLARAMIEDNYDNWRHWTICSTKYVGLPPRPIPDSPKLRYETVSNPDLILTQFKY